MAYIQDANDPNAQQQQGQAGAAPGGMNQPPQTATGTGSASNATTGGSPQGVTAQPTTGHTPPVQNLQAYLAANAPQAVQMGQNIAGNLNQTVGKVTGDINAGQQAVGQQVQASNVAPNMDLINQAASNPTEFVKTPQNVTDFLAQGNTTYNGPATFESTPQYSALNSEVQKAIQSAPNINKPGGVQQLVTGQEQNPTLGMENLDTLLLQENPQAMAPIQAAIPQFANLGNTLSGAASSTNKAIQDAIANDQAGKAAVNDRFLTGQNAVVPEFQKNVSNNLQTDIGKVNSWNTAVNALAPAENQIISEWPFLRGINAFQNPSTLNQPTLAQSATPQDVAYQQALETLLGDSFNPYFDATGVTPFQDPGASPTPQSVLNPSVINLTPFVPGIGHTLDMSLWPLGEKNPPPGGFRAS